MTMLGRVMMAVPLLGALLLAGCGGDGSAPVMPGQQAGQGVAVGEPNGGMPAVSEFIKAAQEEACADQKNRLYLIDSKYVFWDRAGNCADNAYAQRLFGAQPQMVLCQVSDSIAGPRTFCSDDKSRAMFETIQANLDKPDLGLGAGHKVEPIAFLPKSGTAIPFESLAKDALSGVKTRRQVVIKDAAAWERLWSEHGKGRVPAPELPKVDFSRQMVVGVFAGEFGNACHSTSIVRVGSRDGRMVVEYEERDLTPVAICLPVVAQPMHLVAVERNDAAVDFLAVRAGALEFKTIESTTRSGIDHARGVTIKDQGAWEALWLEHAGSDAKPPVVDFRSKMVIGVFMGRQENGCYSTTISNVSRDSNKINVLHLDAVPGKSVLCTLAITAPAHLVEIDRSDVPVEFAREVRTVE